MKILLIALFVASFFILPSCRKVVGEGPVVTQTRSVGSFTGISFETAGKVNFTIGQEQRVELIAQQNILDILQTNIVSGVLHIDFKDNVRAKNYEEIIVNITAPSVDYLRLSGSGDMNVHGDLAANGLTMTISGSGNIYVQNAVIADKIKASVSGSGSMSILNGSAINEDIDISGSGNIDVAGVPAQYAASRTSGSGDVKVNLTKTLDVHISGSGSVYYHGSPVVSTHISGSGKVIPF
jgi:hypothetical protein